MIAAATNTTTARYHALDSLRATMMLLGVYIHAIAALSIIPDVWWYRDAAAGRAFDLQLLAIHTFRMPVFFAMAGFFGALLLERRGRRGFAVNRSKPAWGLPPGSPVQRQEAASRTKAGLPVAGADDVVEVPAAPTARRAP